MNLQHAQEAIMDAISCALAGQHDTAHALLDHAETLMTGKEKSGQAAHLMEFMDSYEKRLTRRI